MEGFDLQLYYCLATFVLYTYVMYMPVTCIFEDLFHSYCMRT